MCSVVAINKLNSEESDDAPASEAHSVRLSLRGETEVGQGGLGPRDEQKALDASPRGCRDCEQLGSVVGPDA